MADRDALDRLLDAALSTYADPGPNLAPRILAAVSDRTAPRLRLAAWALPLAVATAVLALLALIAPWRVTQRPRSAQPTETAASASPAIVRAPAQPSAHRAARHTPRPPAARTVSSPRQETFPAPAPLSPQEQALVHLVAAASAEQRAHLLQQQQQASEPIRIAAISIPPIAPPAEGKE